MSQSGPYNPLDKINLAKSIEAEALSRPVRALADVSGVSGAGVYVIYYDGTFGPYLPIKAGSRNDPSIRPIYVGKAIPKGARKGGLGLDAAKGRALADRISQHAGSIREAENLSLDDFFYRHLVIDDIWIPLGENMLIEKFSPLWNQAIDGFGNKTPGRRRATQFKSPWDVLHPGRNFARMLADGPMTVEYLVRRVDDYFAGRKLAPLPKAIARQQALEQALDDES